MEQDSKDNPQIENQDNPKDCGCNGNCSPPKKNNTFVKVIFTVLFLAALGIIAVKLFNQPSPAAVKGACCPPGSTSGCDTTKAKTCDTTRGSSCCPKK